MYERAAGIVLALLTISAAGLPTTGSPYWDTGIMAAEKAEAAVRVKGYYRKNGTYVQPHYRSNPDRNPYNNWSFPGNTNPYTGKTATGNPDTYLRKYNKPRSSYYRSPSYSSTKLESPIKSLTAPTTTPSLFLPASFVSPLGTPCLPGMEGSCQFIDQFIDLMRKNTEEMSRKEQRESEEEERRRAQEAASSAAMEQEQIAANKKVCLERQRKMEESMRDQIAYHDLQLQQFDTDQARAEQVLRDENIKQELFNRRLMAKMGLTTDTGGLEWMQEQSRKGEEALSYLIKKGTIVRERLVQQHHGILRDYQNTQGCE